MLHSNCAGSRAPVVSKHISGHVLLRYRRGTLSLFPALRYINRTHYHLYSLLIARCRALISIFILTPPCSIAQNSSSHSPDSWRPPDQSEFVLDRATGSKRSKLLQPRFNCNFRVEGTTSAPLHRPFKSRLKSRSDCERWRHTEASRRKSSLLGRIPSFPRSSGSFASSFPLKRKSSCRLNRSFKLQGLPSDLIFTAMFCFVLDSEPILWITVAGPVAFMRHCAKTSRSISSLAIPKTAASEGSNPATLEQHTSSIQSIFMSFRSMRTLSSPETFAMYACTAF